MKHGWLSIITSRNTVWIVELLFFILQIAQTVFSFMLIEEGGLAFQIMCTVLAGLYFWRTVIHFCYRMNDPRKEGYLIARILFTVLIWALNVFQMYILGDIDDYKAIWLTITILSFSNIGLEVCVYYRVNVQEPDETGMIVRHPQKQLSFVRSIPIEPVEGDTDDKPLVQHSMDDSVYEQIKAFKDTKVLYIMLHNEKEHNRTSSVTEK